MNAWWLRLTRRGRQERHLDAELRDHLDRHVATLRANGLSEAEAQRQARLAFGGLDAIKEQCRDARGTRWLDDLARDLRYTLRVLRRAPVFTASVVCSLALGIGGVTALFSVFNALALKPLPVPRPDRLVTLAAGVDRPNPSFPYPTFDHLRTHTRTLTGLFAYSFSARLTIGAGDTAELATPALVSGEYFTTLDVRPSLGRLLGPDDDRPGVQVAVLSDAYWTRRFGADPSIVGRTITLNARPFTVVGVTAPGFTGANVGSAPELYVPLRARDVLVASEPWWHQRSFTWLELTGRLRDDVTREQAEAELHGLFQQTQRARVDSLTDAAQRASAEDYMRRARLRLTSAAEGVDSSGLRTKLSGALAVLIGIAAAVLIIACLNIANLLLARSAARQREMAVRLAIGAGRGRLVRQLLTETLVLTALGAAGGVAIASWAAPAIVRMHFPLATAAPPLAPTLDARVLAVTVLLALVAALFFGIVPALRATRTVAAGSLQARGVKGHPTRVRLDGTLVVLQIALSIVLLVCAALFTRSLQSLGARDAGYSRANVLMFAIDPHGAGLEGPAVVATYDALRARMAALPGVDASTVSVVRPVDDRFYFVTMVEGVDGTLMTSDKHQPVAENIVGPGFFDTYRIPLRLGREFDERDRVGTPKVVVISATLARTLFGAGNPVGHSISLGGPKGPEPHEIVGVASDIRYGSLKDAPRGVIYVPALQGDLARAWFALSYAVRTTAPTATTLEAVRQAVRETHPRLALDRVMTLEAETRASLARERVLASLSGYFGGLALLLVSLGLYGLMAYLVLQRTAEFGVRLALGATMRNVRGLVLRRAAGLIAAGLLLGLPAAYAATRLLGALVYDVTPRDPASFTTAGLLLAAGALIAVWLPARRASRVDPCVALRAE